MKFYRPLLMRMAMKDYLFKGFKPGNVKLAYCLLKSYILDYHSGNHLLFFSCPFTLLVTPATTVALGIVLVLLFLVSFLMAGSELAFFSLTAKEISIIKSRSKPSYRRLAHLLDQPKNLLATILITNSFVNIGIILILNLLLGDVFTQFNLIPWVSSVIRILLIIVLLVLFAEVLPRIWATHQKIIFAANAAVAVEIFNYAFGGLSKRIARLNVGLEKSLAVDKQSAMEQNELDEAIDLLPEEEASNEEKEILKGIRKFGDTEVRSIMRTRMDVSGIEISTPFNEVIKRIEKLHYSRLPVYRNNLDEPAGMLHTKDLIPHLNEAADYDWHSLMRPPIFVHEQKLIEDLLQEFRNKRNHFAIVVDEFGGTSGIVTLEDIMEEIIGEIKDEFDDEESANTKLDDFNFIFEGKTMINDACKAMGLPASTFDVLRGDSDSVAGLVLEIAGEFPEENSVLQTDQFSFIPLQILRNRIDKVQIIINQEASPNS